MEAATPLHRCAACSRAVIVLDGKVIRACRCEAPVAGEMRAVVRGRAALGWATPPVVPEAETS